MKKRARKWKRQHICHHRSVVITSSSTAVDIEAWKEENNIYWSREKDVCINNMGEIGRRSSRWMRGINYLINERANLVTSWGRCCATDTGLCVSGDLSGSGEGELYPRRVLLPHVTPSPQNTRGERFAPESDNRAADPDRTSAHPAAAAGAGCEPHLRTHSPCESHLAARSRPWMHRESLVRPRYNGGSPHPRWARNSPDCSPSVHAPLPRGPLPLGSADYASSPSQIAI